MLLRAYFGAALVLPLMGMVSHPATLIFLRLVQGVLSGTISAAQTLMAASVPRSRSGLALGGLSSAVFSGALSGCFIGGWSSAVVGYRASFFLAGGVSLLSALLIVFGVRESFHPDMGGGGFLNSLRPGRGQMRSVVPILALMATVMFVVQFDSAYIPLFVQEIHGTLQGAAFWTGSLFACSAIAGAAAGLAMGWLADRVSAPTIGRWSAIAAGILMLPVACVHSMGALIALRFGTTFASGGLDPAFQIWLSKVTPNRYRGAVFGWSATARYLGMSLAPLAGGLVATALGLRGLFVCGAILYMLLAVVLTLVARRIAAPPEPHPMHAGSTNA
jgi:DHA1 family multidrug resistance protein-like MFS transporter